MRYICGWITLLFVLVDVPSYALDLSPLSKCSIQVFNKIRQTRTWSGEAPAGCFGKVHVEKRLAGIFVTIWLTENSNQGWARLSLSSAMGFSEFDDKLGFTKASRDITARAIRLERCLNSIISVNDPLECRDSGTKSYLAGEEIGIEHKRLVWLDDNGRHSVVEYSYGDTSAVVSPPADLFNGQEMLPGMDLNLHIRDSE